VGSWVVGAVVVPGSLVSMRGNSIGIDVSGPGKLSVARLPPVPAN